MSLKLAQRISRTETAKETFRKNKISQRQVRLVLEAFEELIANDIFYHGEFKWLGMFKLYAKKIEPRYQAFHAKGIVSLVDSYAKIFIKPSKRLSQIASGSEFIMGEEF